MRVGPAVPTLAEVTLSYRGAVQAARVADTMPMFRPVVEFGNSGLPATRRPPRPSWLPGQLDLMVGRLLNTDPIVFATAELFLDRAGDVRAVADALSPCTGRVSTHGSGGSNRSPAWTSPTENNGWRCIRASRSPGCSASPELRLSPSPCPSLRCFGCAYERTRPGRSPARCAGPRTGRATRRGRRRSPPG